MRAHHLGFDDFEVTPYRRLWLGLQYDSETVGNGALATTLTPGLLLGAVVGAAVAAVATGAILRRW